MLSTTEHMIPLPNASGHMHAVLAVAGVMALVLWADGWLLQPWLSRRAYWRARTERAKRFEGSAFGRFMIRAFLFYGGSLAGVIVSFETHDARYAFVFAAVSVLMILLLPRPQPADATRPPT